MGQYHHVVNLDKRQYLHPHRFDDGLKLLEFGCSRGGTMEALAVLLAAQNGRGLGDLQTDDPLIGSWAGDRIAIVGDYAEPGDPVGWNAALDISTYEETGHEGWEELSERLIPVMKAGDPSVLRQT